MIEIRVNEVLKERNKVLTIKIPSNEVDFHGLEEGDKVSAKLIIYKEESKSLDDGQNEKLTSF